MLEAALAELADPVRRRLFVDVVGSSLTRGSRSENDHRCKAREQIHVPIRRFSRQMFGDFHADGDFESAISGVLVVFQIELLDVEMPCATAYEGCVCVLESEDATPFFAESHQKGAGTASNVDNGRRFEICCDSCGDCRRAPARGFFHAGLVELFVVEPVVWKEPRLEPRHSP